MPTPPSDVSTFATAYHGLLHVSECLQYKKSREGAIAGKNREAHHKISCAFGLGVRGMTTIALIRHAATEWNECGRVQSVTDVPLSDGGRETGRAWETPPQLAGFNWVSSPLV